MGKKTSLYLTDSVLARVEADGGKLPDILIAGLERIPGVRGDADSGRYGPAAAGGHHRCHGGSG
jgi:hypothetical protein